MQAILSKKQLGYMLGAVLILSLGAFMLAGVNNAQAAAPLTADQLFGESLTGDTFADEAGLGSSNLTDTIGQNIRVALGFLGVIAVVIILLGGFKWMTAGGNDDKLKKAKQLLFSGIIGLIIILSAYAIASFVLESLVTATL
mgnify:FL=1